MFNAKQAKVKSKTTLDDIKASVKNVYLPLVAKEIEKATDRGEFCVEWVSDTIKDREVEPLIQIIKEFGFTVIQKVNPEAEVHLEVSWRDV